MALIFFRRKLAFFLGFLLFFSCQANRSPAPFLGLIEGTQTTIDLNSAENANHRSTAGSIFHELPNGNSLAEREVFDTAKSYLQTNDRIFVDGTGREFLFRGFNISGNVKLAQHGYKPFANESDAELAFQRLGKTTGSNIIRYTIAWEGVHPAVDTIDYNYLDSVVSQLKKAINNRFYILLDYHQDLFSRHLFNKDSWHTGNGAPKWITQGGTYPKEYCGIVCANWSQNALTNEAIRRAFRNFWNNAPLSTQAGTRRMQDEFIWQIGKSVSYIKSKLSDEEFSFVLGLDPINEPVDGGMEGLTPAQWDNQKLWPLYQKLRISLDQNGWQNKKIFAEPLVYWNTNIGQAITPATGGGYLEYPPGQKFVFNSHFYDAARMGIDLTGIDNATYFRYLDDIRKESRFMQIPAFLSEFGMWLKGTGAKDTARMINAVYQALEVSDIGENPKSRFVDFYSNPVSATQWHWDFYYDKHSEYMNGNPSKLITGKDAWNGEDFSVVGNYGTEFNLDKYVIQRAYVRKSQGRIMSTYYNAVGSDSWNKVFSWGAIKPGNSESQYFGDRRFLIIIWRGRNSSLPTEVYLPPHINPNQLILLTENQVYNKTLGSTIQQKVDEAIWSVEPNRVADSGNLVFIWDDPNELETGDSIHYALLVDGNGLNLSDAQLSTLQTKLTQRIILEKKSPVYLIGKMTPSGYPAQ
ncbi:glycoside hydrolase family 5 [Leptospira ryugenii]|uniref:Glycoside hydrolase family 5 n=1 Tax=Leptospira ryugenii TaxID=1917863 RepID=A0A2P2E3Z6_9LEPT|nr:cellulase family glycosylhydrolase [Leptospira ryugenii]GBF51605.1 glycoside hydrolase family 5 [Leptospira ryugenii]